MSALYSVKIDDQPAVFFLVDPENKAYNTIGRVIDRYIKDAGLHPTIVSYRCQGHWKARGLPYILFEPEHSGE